MLEGWYCRSLANQQSSHSEEPHVDVNGDESGTDDSVGHERAEGLGLQSAGVNKPMDYKTQYRYLKRKLKFLIYENEFFQDALRSNQRRLLKVSRDRAFLLDRLLQYEKPASSSDSDETESSDDESKKKKLPQNSMPTTSNGPTRGRKKKTPAGSQSDNAGNNSSAQQTPVPEIITNTNENARDVPSSEHNLEHQADHQQHHQLDDQQLVEPQQHGHDDQISTADAVECLLQSKQSSVVDMMPERTPTVPTEMFSNEPSLDSETNEHIVDGSSPSHVAAEECVPMEYSN